MKTWISHLVAIFMALAASLLLGQSALFCTITTDVLILFEQIGMFLMILLVACGFTSGVASLRKDGKLKGVVWSSILWALVSTLLVSLIGAVIFLLYPSPFPVTSTSGENSAFLATYPLDSSLMADMLANPASFLTFGILPALLIACFIIGFFMKPNVEVVRPAYVVMNSFSEVMFRLSRAFTLASYFLVFFAASSFFSSLMREGSIFVAGRFLSMLVFACLAALLVILPLLFSLFTGFKVNPYKVLYRSVASLSIGLFTGSAMVSAVVNEPVTRHNLGCQKRTGATTIPLYVLFGRGGCAMMATLCSLSLLFAADSAKVTPLVVFLVALAAALTSFLASMHLGYEVFLLTVLTFRVLGVDMYGVEVSLLALLPLLNGMGVMVDNLIANMGCAYTSHMQGVRVDTPYGDIL